jgi:transcriptional regulator with XRE-family HTH domain
MTQFGEELRRLRKRSGLSQELLAAGAGLSTEAVSLLERGRRTPRMTTMRLLADGMDLAQIDREAFYASAAPTSAQDLADNLDRDRDVLPTSGPAGGLGADATAGMSDPLPIERERLLHERLSVFADSFTSEAVNAVCGAGLTEAEILDLLTTLVAKSLIDRHDDG